MSHDAVDQECESGVCNWSHDDIVDVLQEARAHRMTYQKEEELLRKKRKKTKRSKAQDSSEPMEF